MEASFANQGVLSENVGFVRSTLESGLRSMQQKMNDAFVQRVQLLEDVSGLKRKDEQFLSGAPKKRKHSASTELYPDKVVSKSEVRSKDIPHWLLHLWNLAIPFETSQTRSSFSMLETQTIETSPATELLPNRSKTTFILWWLENRKLIFARVRARANNSKYVSIMKRV